MKLAKTPVKYLLGILLMGTAVQTMALSLGRMRGATLVGRPLDVTLSAHLDGTEGLSAVCLAADVFFGDSQVPQDKVRVVNSQGASGEALIRIRTSSNVDEPVVTLYVREGCLQKNTRKYVLLAEVAAENTNPVPVVSGEAMAAGPLAAPVPGGHGATDNGLKSQAGAARSADGKAQRARSEKNPSVAGNELRAAAPAAVLRAAPSIRSAAKATPGSVRKSGSRLKLDPVDLAAERDPVLRSTSELLTEPSMNAQQRAAAAALWQALNAQPQDMVRDNQRLKSLETDVAGMLAQSQKTEKAVMEMRRQLEQARGERYNNWLVYTLYAFLGAFLLVILALWMRSRQQSRVSRGSWWGKGFAEDSAPYMAEGTGNTGKAYLRRAPEAESVSAGPLLDSLVDFDPSEPFSEAPKNTPASSAVARPRVAESRFPAEFLPSLSGISSMPRIVNAEELFDVQQQADFFLSLGRPDKAVDVLRHHIMDNVETSALVYLDLFDLYHSLGRREDYDALRTDFNKMFNAKVPAFDEYAVDTHDLEFYTEALSRIEALWPTPKVLDVLEESIFRKPDSRGEVFSLAAYRELLLLHSIAKRIVGRPPGDAEAPVRPSDAPSIPTMPDTLPSVAGFGPTSIQPLSARFQIVAPLPSPAVGSATDPTQPPASPRLGLDIDLSVGEGGEGDLAPFPPIEAGARPPQAAANNLIEFDLDFPDSSGSRQKP